MQLRKVDWLVLPLALVGGTLLVPGTLGGDASRMLIIFLGLVSASVLPTVSLLVNSMTASGRSVKSINELESELRHAMDALFFLFGSVAVVVSALVALSIPTPVIASRVPYLADQILPRFGQSIVVIFTAMIVLRMGQIPAILHRTLSLRHTIAVEEARRETIERAPNAQQVRAAFPTHPDFGKNVNLEDAIR